MQATKCIEMKGDWGKGYGRKGAALHGLGRFDQAIAAYEKGLDVEPGLAMLTKGLDDAKREAEMEAARWRARELACLCLRTGCGGIAQPAQTAQGGRARCAAASHSVICRWDG